MTLEKTPLPSFIADASQHGIPHGRFGEQLAGFFKAACAEIEDLPEGTEGPTDITWFPERAWAGRVWIPASATGTAVMEEGGEAEEIEFFGFVAFVQPTDSDPRDFQAKADFTDVLAADNPDWQIDLGDEVIGKWAGENGREADVTLIWGRSLVRDAYAVSAELRDKTVDQDPLFTNRFTLIAPDNLQNYGDEGFLEIKLWNVKGKQLAQESLYAIEEKPAEDEAGDVAEDAEETTAR